MDIKVIVATHKKYRMPKDPMYLPIQVGAQNKEEIGYTPDNTGDNISVKNPQFCELTGLYWAWKNLKCDYLGLAHYRRHFALSKQKDKFDGLLKLAQAEKIFESTDIILPKLRKYYIENLYSHYAHSLYVEPLDEAGKIIAEDYPEYLPEFERLKKRTSAHMFNMYIMKKEISDAYCEWLFDILFKLEARLGDKEYDAFHNRFYGRVSELLLDVFINTNKLSYKEVPAIHMEKVNWYQKGKSFLKAKFLGKKYDKSF